MQYFYTIYEDAKGERRFYQGDKRELFPNLRRIGTAFIGQWPIRYPLMLIDGEFIYDQFPELSPFVPVAPEEWPTFPENTNFDWGLSISQIDNKFGSKTGIVVRNRGIKVKDFPKRILPKMGLRSPDIEKIFCCYCGAWLVAPLFATREHLVPTSKRGNNSKENLRPCCGPCNTWRSSLHYNTWIGNIKEILKVKTSYMMMGRLYSVSDMQTIVENARELRDYVDHNFEKLIRPAEEEDDPSFFEIGINDNIRDKIYAPKKKEPIQEKTYSPKLLECEQDLSLEGDGVYIEEDPPEQFYERWKTFPDPKFHEDQQEDGYVSEWKYLPPILKF